MYSPAKAQRSAPPLLGGGGLSMLGSTGIKEARAAVTLVQTPPGGSHESRTSASLEKRARFAEEWPVAVSGGWDEVMRLLESSSPDPNTRQILRDLAAD